MIFIILWFINFMWQGFGTGVRELTQMEQWPLCRGGKGEVRPVVCCQCFLFPSVP